MTKKSSFPTLAELAQTDLDLQEEKTVLEAIGRMALESAHRQSSNMKKISAMARAIARGDVPDSDRAALAATLQQLARQCDCEVLEHLRALRRPNRSRHAFSDPELDDGEEGNWHCAFVPPAANH